MITKANITAMRPKLTDAMNAVLRGFDLRGAIGTITYDPTGGTASMRLSVSTLRTPEQAIDVERQDWTRHCALYGFEPDDFHGKVKLLHDGKPSDFTLMGFKHKARKNNVRIKRTSDGKEFVANADTLLRRLGRSVPQ